MESFRSIIENFENKLTKDMIIVEDKKTENTVKSKPKKPNKSESPEKLLRDNKIKIRLVTPTNFGTEIMLAKHYDEKQIKSILKGYSFEIKKNSVFIHI